MRRSELKRSAGLSSRGSGGACPPKPDNHPYCPHGLYAAAGCRDCAEPRKRYDGQEWRRLVFEDHADAFTLLSSLGGRPGVVTCEWCLLVGGEMTPAEEAHHLLTRQSLRRSLPPAAYAVAAMDPRNGIPLCRECHADHHSRRHPICRDALRPVAFEFAAELDERFGTRLLAWLDRTYPEQTA